MAMKRVTYAEVRDSMKPGDVIAFGGKGQFSEIIKMATRSGVSHVGTILQTKVVEDDSGHFFNQIIESTDHDGGVGVYRASERIASYSGEVWWLPMKRDLWSTRFDRAKFYNFLFNQAKEHKRYDPVQAVKSAVDFLDKAGGATKNTEDFSRFFCSELVAAGLEAGGAVPSINASEVTPIDLCRWAIFEEEYCLLQGDAREISRFGTMDPALWS